MVNLESGHQSGNLPRSAHQWVCKSRLMFAHRMVVKIVRVVPAASHTGETHAEIARYSARPKPISSIAQKSGLGDHASEQLFCKGETIMISQSPK